jgi:hypothetical protein
MLPPSHTRKHVHSHPLHPLPGREHLLFYARIKALSGKRLRRAVDDALRSVNLLGVGEELVGGYSGGMKRRLSVAIALVGDPSVVYLDEPSTGLDPASRQLLWNVIRAARRERAVVLTTHSMEEAEALCDRWRSPPPLVAALAHAGRRARGGCDAMPSSGKYVAASLWKAAVGQGRVGSCPHAKGPPVSAQPQDGGNRTTDVHTHAHTLTHTHTHARLHGTHTHVPGCVLQAGHLCGGAAAVPGRPQRPGVPLWRLHELLRDHACGAGGRWAWHATVVRVCFCGGWGAQLG